MTVTIVQATPETLNVIEAWLSVEDQAYRDAMNALIERRDFDGEIPGQGFLCNWHMVRKSFARDPANVHVLMADGRAVGFVDEMDILEIRPDLRGKGYGRLLADFMVRKAQANDHSVAIIEIAPETAVPFWKTMGFTPVDGRIGGGGGVFAYKELDHAFSLPAGETAGYCIAFYPPDRDYDPSVAPYRVFEGKGVILPNGAIQLPTRAFGFAPHITHPENSVVAITVDGETIFEDRVSRSSAETFGVRRDPTHIYYCDVITRG